MPQRYLVTLNVAVNLGMTRNPAINECPSEISFSKETVRRAIGTRAVCDDLGHYGQRNPNLSDQNRRAPTQRATPFYSRHRVDRGTNSS